jgi:hypothetical protein
MSLSDVSTPSKPDDSGFKPVRKGHGDRGNAYKRQQLLKGRNPKEMGIKKTKKLKEFYYAVCEHKDKRGRLDCKKRFGGWTIDLVMGNKALHEAAHEAADRKIAEQAAWK